MGNAREGPIGGNLEAAGPITDGDPAGRIASSFESTLLLHTQQTYT